MIVSEAFIKLNCFGTNDTFNIDLFSDTKGKGSKYKPDIGANTI